MKRRKIFRSHNDRNSSCRSGARYAAAKLTVAAGAVKEQDIQQLHWQQHQPQGRNKTSCREALTCSSLLNSSSSYSRVTRHAAATLLAAAAVVDEQDM